MRCDYENEDNVRCPLNAAFNIDCGTEYVYSCTSHLTSSILWKIGNRRGESIQVIRMHNDFL